MFDEKTGVNKSLDTVPLTVIPEAGSIKLDSMVIYKLIVYFHGND
jgi:hypothetical protein